MSENNILIYYRYCEGCGSPDPTFSNFPLYPDPENVYCKIFCVYHTILNISASVSRKKETLQKSIILDINFLKIGM
jgi:hypothetical protein